MPKDHPARDMQGHLLLGRESAAADSDLRGSGPVLWNTVSLRSEWFAPGRVYRADEVDATHSPVFHQMEGVGRGQWDYHVRPERLLGAVCP